MTANVGTLYIDTVSTVGASVWRKATGTGNTGWVVTDGDTGWRSVTPASHANMTDAIVHIRRTFQTVYVRFQFQAVNAALSLIDLFSLPSGFRALDSSTGFFAIATANGATGRIRVNESSVYIPALSSTLRVAYAVIGQHAQVFSLPCTESWPTSLPGSAA